MKKVIASLLHILLAVIVLVSGTSFTVKKMVCLSSGNVETGLYTLDGCCAEEDAGSEVELWEPCCVYSSETFYLDQNAPLKELSIKTTDLIYLPAQLFHIPALAAAEHHRAYIPYADLPPPLSGRERLIYNSIFII